MNNNDILQTRINILQRQIDDAIKSGSTHNIMGYPMPDQIKDWERLIKKAKKQMAA